MSNYQRVIIPATPSATHPATRRFAPKGSHLGPGHTAGARQLHRPAVAAAAVEPEIDAAAADAFAWQREGLCLARLGQKKLAFHMVTLW